MRQQDFPGPGIDAGRIGLEAAAAAQGTGDKH